MKSSIVYRVDLKFYWNRHWLSASHAGLGPPAESAESAERFLYRAHRLELHSSRRTAWAQLNQLSSLFPSLPSLHFSSLIFILFPLHSHFPLSLIFPHFPLLTLTLDLKKSISLFGSYFSQIPLAHNSFSSPYLQQILSLQIFNLLPKNFLS